MIAFDGYLKKYLHEILVYMEGFKIRHKSGVNCEY